LPTAAWLLTFGQEYFSHGNTCAHQIGAKYEMQKSIWLNLHRLFFIETREFNQEYLIHSAILTFNQPFDITDVDAIH
jgi:hypothetical protein